jgi:formiminotetrahydrofolate cyclodeaminase
MNNDMTGFLSDLASSAPIPGGGGASSLVGATGVALCSMVANLTSGKKKYAEYQSDIEAILEKGEELRLKLIGLIDKDAEAFEPLSKAYGISKDNPSRNIIIEDALKNACTAPFEILETLSESSDLVYELCTKGSRLAISDVGCAAALISAAAKGAVMNIYINTKLMEDREYADSLNEKSYNLVSDITSCCDKVYDIINENLGGIPS